MSSYIKPVQIIDENTVPTKLRVVEVSRNSISKDIDLYTHKHTDAHEDMGAKTSNAVSSDTNESIDGAVISRFLAFRDAQLRSKLQFALLDEEEVASADDAINIDSPKITYRFVISHEVKDNTLRPLAEFIHRYLVFGVLYDWYSQFGMQQAYLYSSQLSDIESKIISILRGPSIVKRPMQPFGPAKKIY